MYQRRTHAYGKTPPCRFRYADRSRRAGRDLSSASCDCLGWSCFMTTRETGFAEWQKHTKQEGEAADEAVQQV